MGLSTERKVFIGILTLAGVALLLDQGLFGPSEASALPDPALSPDVTSPVSAASTPNQAPLRSAAQVLMDRLNASAEPHAQASLGSAFSLEQLIEPVMDAVVTPDATGTPTQTAAQQPSLPVIQASAVNLPALSAVMPSNTGGGAVLGGKLIRVGQTDANGFTLKQVRERGVILERDGRLFSLEMPMQTGP